MTSPQKLLKNGNLHASKRLGQNFLKDPSTAETIVARARILPEDVVLEIGAGLGALTLPLARIARKVYAVEKDLPVAALLKNEIDRHRIDTVDILNKNILDLDLRALSGHERRKLLVVGNLPYNISSQILVRLIGERASVSRCILMFQKELVVRICAPPGGRSYGRLSAMLAYCATVRKIADVNAALFFPRPKVDSQVIEIEFTEQPDFPADDETFLFRVIKAAFSKRRKMLRNTLAGGELDIDLKTAKDSLEKARIDPTRRAETLTVEEFVRLSNTIYRSSAIDTVRSPSMLT